MKTLFLFLTFLFLSCKPSYQLTQQDRVLLRKYPEVILLQSGKKHIVHARKLEISDSLHNAFQTDLAQEYQEAMYLD